MTSRRLTTLAVANAKPRRNGAGELVRTELPDAGCPGLYLVVQPSRLKSWALRYRFGGRTRKLVLGAAANGEGEGGLTLAAARSAAAAARHELERGVDPGAAKQAAKTASQGAVQGADSVEAQAAKFIELHGKRKLRARTLAQYQSVLDRLVLPKWRGRMVHEIRRRDVIALVEDIATDRPIMANRTLGVLSKFFNWLVARDVIAASPTHGVEMPGQETARDRVLDDNEIRALWAACEDDAVFGAAVRTMLLTGARRTEVSAMAWSELDAEERLWTIPKERSKNKHEHKVALSPLAWQVITSVPRISETFVFSTSGDGPIRNFHRVKDHLDGKLKFEQPFVLHDIRRSVASGLQRLGVRVEVIEAALGHTSGVRAGIVGRYQRHDYADERRDALQRWSDHIAALASGGQPAKVVRLRS
jgi:integrase